MCAISTRCFNLCGFKSCKKWSKPSVVILIDEIWGGENLQVWYSWTEYKNRLKLQYSSFLKLSMIVNCSALSWGDVPRPGRCLLHTSNTRLLPWVSLLKWLAPLVAAKRETRVLIVSWFRCYSTTTTSFLLAWS